MSAAEAISVVPISPWNWRVLLPACLATAVLFISLPLFERPSAPAGDLLHLRTLDTAVLPVPPPPPPVRTRRLNRSEPPKPRLQPPKALLTPLRVAMDLELALGNLAGDYAINFAVQDEALNRELKDLVFELSELDEPPRPRAVLRPIYPPRARLRKIEGSVTIEFTVDATGKVRQERITQSQPPEVFDHAALRAIRSWTFTPGRRDGQAVATRVIQTITFSLE